MPVIFSIKENFVDIVGQFWEYIFLGGIKTFILESTYGSYYYHC